MNSLSATQLDLFAAAKADRGDMAKATTFRSAESQSIQSLQFPEFGTYAGIQAQTTRAASRLIAATASETEVQGLLKERSELLDRKFAGTITRKESVRLEYVRWSLDRIEDARYGQDLDRLEEYVDRYEHFLHDLDEFKIALRNASSRGR